MAQNLPLRRFVAAPDSVAFGGEAPRQKKGRVLVVEGVPRNAKMTATTEPFQEFLPGAQQTGSLSDHDAFLLVSSLPFNRRVRMFWDMIHRASSPPSKAGADRHPSLDRKTLHAVTMSLQFDLCNEIYWITAGDDQMPLTGCFFDLAPRGGVPPVQQVEEAQLLVLALGTIHAVANPLSPWKSVQATFASLSHNIQLKPRINDRIFGAVQRICAPGIAGTVKSHVLARSEQVKRGIRSQPKKGGLHKSYAGFGYKELGLLTNDTSGWTDLLAHGETNLALTSQEAQDRAHSYRGRKEVWASRHESSRRLIESMVNT
ncbi:hypothetical protein PG997_008891 [Apiospora hydei]|uniref:Uncharacterized protein n=1 Tax=Apiospora hydei TaxID=1337664 RepID=A0ABR1WC27_9PEZI